MDDRTNKTLSIENQELIILVKQTLDSGGEFKLLVTGGSMFPFIKHLRDSVILTSPSARTLRRGEIVLVARETKQLVLHRIVKMKQDGFIMNGDAQLWDEFVPFGQVVAVVQAIERKGRLISCDSRLYRFLSGMWMLLRPFRGLLFKVMRILAAISRKIIPSK